MDKSHQVAEALLDVEDLRFVWPNGTVVLDNLSLVLYPGQHVGLSGSNGSGKTTLFKCITGLLTPQSGIVRLDNRQIRSREDFCFLRQHVGLVLQDADDQLFFPTLAEDIAFGPLNLGIPEKEAAQRAAESLELVGLAGFENRLTHQLSGGEKKLAALAAILAMHPRALLLDEPLNGLDEAACARVNALICNLACTVVLVSHDKDYLDGISTDRLHLENGCLHNFA